jgi:MYXO-CTERM domain-containing protein
MKVRTLSLVAGFGGSLLMAASAEAGFLGLEAVRITQTSAGQDLVMDLGMPATFEVWRVYAAFSDPGDQLIAGAGTPGQAFSVSSADGTGFINDDVFGGDRPVTEAAAGAIGSLNWDSWYTVGNEFIDVLPNFQDGTPQPLDAVLAAPADLPGPNTDPWEIANGSWVASVTIENPDGNQEQTPQTVAGNYANNKVLLMQLVIDNPNGTNGISGEMAVLITQNGVPSQINGVTFNTLPAPGAMALLGLAGLAGMRRRRRA